MKTYVGRSSYVDGKTLARRYFEEVFTAPGNLAVADEILHPDVVFENPVAKTKIEGIEAYKRFIESWYRGFPNERTFTVVEIVAEGDTVFAEFLISARHDGEFQGVPASGAHVEVPGVNIFELRDGKLYRVHAFFNPIPLWAPIGRAPASLPTPAPTDGAGRSSGTTVPTADQVQAAVDGYVRSFATADKRLFMDGLAEDVEQEDPVGSERNRGRRALENFWDGLWTSAGRIDFDAREIYVSGPEAALAFTIVQHLRDGREVTIDGIDTFRVDGTGRIELVRGYGKVRS